MPTAPSNPVSPALADQPTVHHRSARQRRSLPRTRMQPNLSAMIDVIFQLLIYFVITASFALDEGVLSATLPTGSGSPAASFEPPPETLDIHLTARDDVNVTINLAGSGQFDSFTDLAAELAALRFHRDDNPAGVFAPDDPIVIHAARDVRWQHVVNAFNAAVKARYTNVNFAPSQ